MPITPVQDHVIAYRERGAGPPIMFLHGWPLDSREFVHQLDGLSEWYRVIAWDAPGAGGSTDPVEGSSLDDWADWVAEFAHSLGLSTIHLAGLSWGGGLALAIAHRHPNLVRSLILMSAYAGWAGSLPPEEVEHRLDLTMANTARPPQEWVPALLDTLLPAGADQDIIDRLTTMLSESHPAATRAALPAFANADLRPILGDVEIPVLLIYGALDTRSPARVWNPLHEAIAGSKLVVIPDVGHMVDLQAPGRCNADIAAFLDQLQTEETT